MHVYLTDVPIFVPTTNNSLLNKPESGMKSTYVISSAIDFLIAYDYSEVCNTQYLTANQYTSYIYTLRNDFGI